MPCSNLFKSTISMTLFSHPSAHLPTPSPSLNYSSPKPLFTLKSPLFLKHKNPHFHFTSTKASTDNGAGIVTAEAAPIVEEETPEVSDSVAAAAVKVEEANGAALFPDSGKVEVLNGFVDSRWVSGTWDLNQFKKDGTTDWDSVIDAEVRRRKWLEDNPESSSNENPVVFDTSIIPRWAWLKRFHLPEAELLNGRAAMVGFFMAYFVDSLTGVGLVDQMGNFFCKTLLFVSVLGVLLIRKKEDFDNIKKLIEETTFYDKQWQATWQDETSSKK